MIFRAVVQIFIEADSASEASDCLSSVLTDQIRKFAGPSSSVLNWNYTKLVGGDNPTLCTKQEIQKASKHIDWPEDEDSAP